MSEDATNGGIVEWDVTESEVEPAAHFTLDVAPPDSPEGAARYKRVLERLRKDRAYFELYVGSELQLRGRT